MTTFTNPSKTWKAVGLLKTDQGYHFNLYITGPSKQDVEQFIRQYKNGAVKVQVRVESVGVERANPLQPVTTPSPTKSWKNISLGISRLDEKEFKDLQLPYRIVYEIDPEFLQDTQPAPNVFDATFQGNDPSVSVECHVTAGNVRAELSEFETNRRDFVVRNPDANTDKTGVFTLTGQRQDTGSWRVRLTRSSGSPRFTLAYSKLIN